MGKDIYTTKYPSPRFKKAGRHALETKKRTKPQLALAWRENSKIREELQRVKRTNAHTGLLNKVGFYAELTRLMRMSQRINFKNVEQGKDQWSVLVLASDIDEFKKVNTTYGHLFGDAAIMRFAMSARRAFNRPNDVVSHWGGDEFLFAFMYPSKQAKAIAELQSERLRRSVNRDGKIFLGNVENTNTEEPDYFSDHDEFHNRILSIGPHKQNLAPFRLGQITVSVGASFYTPNRSTTEENIMKLVSGAIAALKAAKNGGRNCVYIRDENGEIRPMIAPQQISVLPQENRPEPDNPARQKVKNLALE